jgi:hypothetical protein
MADRFTQLVNNVNDVEVGDEVRVKLESSVAGLSSGQIDGTVREKVEHNGKNYLVVSGFGSVEVPARRGNVSIKVYRALAAVPEEPAAAEEETAEGGKRRRGKSRRSRKSRKSTRRRRV